MMRSQLVVHHSADPSQTPQFDKINGYHKRKGFPKSSLGYWVGYHVLIEPSGEVRQARALTDHGAHTAAMCDGGHCNSVAYGVCLAGDFTKADPRPEQLAALYMFWKSLGYPKILLHSDVKKTGCPGKYPFKNELQIRWLADIHQQLKNAVRALPRFLGTLRGNMLGRKIERLENIVDENEH